MTTTLSTRRSLLDGWVTRRVEVIPFPVKLAVVRGDLARSYITKIPHVPHVPTPTEEQPHAA